MGIDEKILRAIGRKDLAAEIGVSRFINRTTGQTFSMSPSSEVGEAVAWLDDALGRLNGNSRNVIADAVGTNAMVAVSLGDMMLTMVYGIQQRHIYENNELILLGNPNRLVEEIDIPNSPKEIDAWQESIIQTFKTKYLETRGGRRWSSGAHRVAALRLLEIASRK